MKLMETRVTKQKVNSKESMAIHVGRHVSHTTHNICLIGKRVPLKCEFRSLEVGICMGVRKGIGPLIKKMVQRGSYVMARVRGAQGGFTRWTSIIATLVESAALCGSQGGDSSKH